MDAAETTVLVSGIVLSALTLWYFFGPKARVSAQVADGVQEVRVVVKGGYSPDVIVVRQGAPVKLDFYRDETASCSEEIVFGDFGIARHLPAFETTTIELMPEKTGEFTFTCGMNMMRGKLVVERAATAAG
ncbi:MAG: cupredoxin domain-containing protein [Gemmatimonadota bacterium]|nr:cupredoxin domain-containing protein [Gemmatimonadota bacterium]